MRSFLYYTVATAASIWLALEIGLRRHWFSWVLLLGPVLIGILVVVSALRHRMKDSKKSIGFRNDE
jgi:D-alanyl-lipoteichoic acid acyltransferase DltB (MBOAT superfamily)